MADVCTSFNSSTPDPYEFWRPSVSMRVLLVYESVALSIGALLNLWILVVSWGPNPIAGAFKYPLCNLAIWDLMFSFTIVCHCLIHPDMLLWLLMMLKENRWLCRLLFAGCYAGVAATIFALLLCPLQRLFVFYDTRWSQYALERRANIVACLTNSAVSMVPVMLVMYGPADGKCFETECGPLSVMQSAWIIYVLSLLIIYVFISVATALVLWKIAKTRSYMSAAHQANTWNEHRQVIKAIFCQTTNPILLTIPGTLYLALNGEGFKDELSSSWHQKLAQALCCLNPLADALSTIWFIKPYRRAAIKQFAPILCKRPTSEGNNDVGDIALS